MLFAHWKKLGGEEQNFPFCCRIIPPPQPPHLLSLSSAAMAGEGTDGG